MLYKVPPTATEGEPWDDVVGRSVMAAELLLDSNPGMLDTLVDSTYPGQSPRPVLGERVLEAARELSWRGT